MKNLFRKIRKLNNKKGFTLLECLVAILIISIMCSSMMTLFNQGITYVSKSRVLDERSSAAQQIVLVRNEGDESSLAEGDGFYVNVPVKIQFTLYFDNEQKRLEELEYNFQAGISQEIVGGKVQVRVVYYDLMQSELENIRY